MRQKHIFWFWLPLFASWLLMTAEGPIISAAINRLPNEIIMLAAMGIVFSLSVTIESPIINLLATSTALTKDRASFLLIRRFTVHWMIVLTAVSIALAFTPLFDLVVVGLLGTPTEVAQWVELGLKIMVLWSAAIAWRRFLQGVMIRFGRTRLVAWGTAVRLISSGSAVLLLVLWGDVPGVILGAIALMVGVLAEAAYATIAVRPIIKTHLAVDSPVSNEQPLVYRELFFFHLPLAATSLLALLAQPLVTSSLARLDNPTLSLAAWPVLFQMMLVARAAAFAWPEVVIALSAGQKTFFPIRKFTLTLSAVLTGFMLVIIFTPLSTFYLFVVQDMTPVAGELVRQSLVLFLLFPALAVFTSWLRGLLIKERATKAVNMGMVINLVVTAVVLAIGLYLRLPGLPTAAVALNLASLCEVIYLAFSTRHILTFNFPLYKFWQPALSNDF